MEFLISEINFFISNLNIKDLIDLLLLWCIFYQVLKFAEKSGVFQVLLGLSFVGLAFLISLYFDFTAVKSLLENIFSNIFLILVLIFQNEIRRGLTELGSRSLMSNLDSVEQATLSEELSKALAFLSKKGIGAIIVIEKQIDLSPFLESGIQIQSQVKSEMIEAIFHPSSKVHDGAVLIKDGKIDSAGLFLPLSTNPALDRNLGSRHRAALGISEITDAKVIVVSEESHSVSFIEEGRLQLEKDMTHLNTSLRDFITSRMSVSKMGRKK